MNCESCKHWKMKHWGGRDDIRGCTLWNNLKHFGKADHSILMSIDYESAINTHGPQIYYEGWAGSGGMQYNNSVITGADMSCELHGIE